MTSNLCRMTLAQGSLSSNPLDVEPKPNRMNPPARSSGAIHPDRPPRVKPKVDVHHPSGSYQHIVCSATALRTEGEGVSFRSFFFTCDWDPFPELNGDSQTPILESNMAFNQRGRVGGGGGGSIKSANEVFSGGD